MAFMQDVAALGHEAARFAAALMQCKISAQIQSARAGLMKVFVLSGFLLIFLVLIAVAAVFLLWGLYMLLADALNPPAAALIIGGGILLIGLIVLLSIFKKAKS